MLKPFKDGVMEFLRKSLRAKFTLVLLIVGIAPLAAASAFFYHTAKDALFRNVFKELKWNINEISGIVEDYFEKASNDLVMASKNTAFTMYFLDPANRGHWLNEQKKTLKYLRSIYPDMVDEACFIEASGREVSRIVKDEVSPDHELSSEEDRSGFFVSAFNVSEGEVFQGRPAISEDTRRWVLPNATPVAIAGRKAAILHFEVTMTYFQRLLKRLINPDRGFGFILSGDGRFMAHTLLDISETEPFPAAVSAATSPELKKVYAKMMAESGVESFSQDGKDYYIIFKPIGSSNVRGVNENRWAIGYAIPSERVYVEMQMLRYNMIALMATVAFVAALAYLLGNYVTRPIRELAAATHRVTAGEMPKVEVRRADELGLLSESFNLMVESVKRRDEALKAMASTDGLTGLFNYRRLKAELEKEVKSASRFNRPLSVIMADVDHFKRYNDANGHASGDLALKRVAEVFAKNMREVDVAARYGGEEFAVIMPETPIEGALLVAERIRKKLEEEEIPFEELLPGEQLTISLGVASFPSDGTSPDELLAAADRALYMAKEGGRNRVCRASG